MAGQIIFEETASYKLARVTTAFRSSFEKHMKDIKLHAGQVNVLIELWRSDGPRQIDLANSLHIKPATISRLLIPLVDKGYIKTGNIEGDGRSNRVFLTQKGINIRSKVAAQWVDLEASYLHKISDIEQPLLRNFLDRMLIAFTGQEEDEE